MKKGFTLAEVLVTLGIIGVVSALTMPSLVQNHQRQVYVTQLRKAVSEIEQAFQMAIVEKRAMTLAESKAFRGGVSTFFNAYLKTSVICSGADKSNCLNTGDYTRIDGSNTGISTINSDNFTCAVLKDGAVACIYWYGTSGALYLDVNGKQGPNIGGRDLYSLLIDNSGNITGHDPIDSSHVTHRSDTDENNAFARIVGDGWEMNY